MGPGPLGGVFLLAGLGIVLFLLGMPWYGLVVFLGIAAVALAVSLFEQS